MKSVNKSRDIDIFLHIFPLLINMLDIKIIIENKELFQSYFYLFSLILIKNKNNYFMGIDRRSIIYIIYIYKYILFIIIIIYILIII